MCITTERSATGRLHTTIHCSTLRLLMMIILRGALCQLATSLVLFQNQQYITMNVVYLPSVFHGPRSPAIFCAKISTNDVTWYIWGYVRKSEPACSEQQLRTPGQRAPCLFWEEFQALVDKKPFVIENYTILNKRNVVFEYSHSSRSLFSLGKLNRRQLDL